MENGIDRRQDPRAPLALPVELKTSLGTIRGSTANISVGGLALLLFLESPKIDDEFQVTITLPDHTEVELNCEKRWSGEIVADVIVYKAIGVQFIDISPRVREIIASLIKDFYMA